MTMNEAPDLDTRTYDDVIAQTEALAMAYTSDTQAGSWQPRPDGTLDFGGVLVRLFATMVQHVTRQLNLVPYKHQLAFTHLLGASRTPPRAARAAVTFLLDDGARTAFVPVGAQVAGVNADGLPVVFETDVELALTRARLTAVFVRDVTLGRYADRTENASGIRTQAYEALGATPPIAPELEPGNRAIEHDVYVVFDQLGMAGATTFSVLATSTTALPQAMVWSAFSGGNWVDLPAVAVTPTSWRLTANAARVGAVPVAGTTARWLRGRFAAATPALRLTTELTIAVQSRPLATAFVNGQRADFTRDVFAFGERPRAGDVFYVANDDAFGLAQVTVDVEVDLTIPTGNVNASGDLTLQWEAWDGVRATVLGTATPATSSPAGFADTTKAFTASGKVTFQLAAPIPRSTIGGVTSRWVRVRIVKGNYGTDTSATVGANNQVTITPASFRPPALATTAMSWSAPVTGTPARMLRRTALTFEDLTATATTPQTLYLPAPEVVYAGAVDTTPSLHLGFDSPFERTVTTLYLQIVAPPAPSAEGFVDPPPPRNPPAMTWEFWDGAHWAVLAADDGTRGLTRSGLVRFLPPDARLLEQFGQSLYWLRARAGSAEFSPMPRIGRISVNTVWASHARTHKAEVLGSSNGTRDQMFKLSQSPVLAGQVIEVAEPETSWVPWGVVADFWASGPRDRHYTIDAAMGAIMFGDGARGMIPPKGQRNIRAVSYRGGGGVAGNTPAHTLVQLKTTVPVVSGVTNHEAAIGGAEIEPIPHMMSRAARGLRHGGRAVTSVDYADLALEASTAIARAAALTPSFDPNHQGDGPDTSPTVLHRDGLVIVVILPTSRSMLSLQCSKVAMPCCWRRTKRSRRCSIRSPVAMAPDGRLVGDRGRPTSSHVSLRFPASITCRSSMSRARHRWRTPTRTRSRSIS